MDRPTVSIIISGGPPAALDDSLNSALGQRHPGVEVLVLEPDGRSDAASHPDRRVRVAAAGRLDSPRARNLAAGQATGDLLCSLRAGDIIAPDYVAMAVGALDRDRAAAWLCTTLAGTPAADGPPRVERIDLMALLGDPPGHAAAVVRRSALLEAGGYAEDVPVPGWEDWDMWISLAERGLTGIGLANGLIRRGPVIEGGQDMWRQSDARVRMLAYLVLKHDATYRAHLGQMLMAKAHMASGLDRRNLALAQHISGSLVPAMEARSEELATLDARLEHLDGQADAERRRSARENALEDAVAQLSGQLEHAVTDLRLIRSSTSWRVTAPIRHARRFLRWLTGGLPLLGSVVARLWL